MRASLRMKAIIVIVFFAVILSGTGLFISTTVIDKLVDDSYKSDADHLSKTIAALVDADKVAFVRDKVSKIYDNCDNRVSSDDWGSDAFNEYVKLYDGIDQTDEFKSIHEYLHKIQENNYVDCCYIIYIDVPTKQGIYLVDAADEDACMPGVFDPIYEVNYESLTNLERGYPPYTTDTVYGWLMTAGAPIHDKNGNVIAYGCVDIPMDDIRAKQRSYFLISLLVFIGLTIVMCLVGFFLVDHVIVKPIRKLSRAAQEFCDKEDKSGDMGFADIKISSRDEIGELSNSMKQMEIDLNTYIKSLTSTREQLSITRERANEMTEKANKDSLTGLRNKRAYDLETIRLDEDIRVKQAMFGIVMVDMNYLKSINDTYGHDKGDVSIKMTSQIICDIFKHSPVFRVGGDEFVVIIENNDYRNINLLVKRFNEMITKKHRNPMLNPWEQISAALGFAIYEEQSDETCADVFKRADEAMYENKKRMKEADLLE